MNSILESTCRICTGCGACVAICSRNAVSLVFDENGFRMPVVNKNNCVNCGMCKKICPKFERNERYTLVKTNVRYAYSNDPYVRKISSSGGIGYEVAKAGVENGYEVWGCVYDYKSMSAKHIAAHTIDEIKAFQGSKYLHSNLVDFYKELISGKSNKLMLISLPCHIRAARNIIDQLSIKKDVVLIDLFCRGVPSQLMWEKYIDYVTEKYNIAPIHSVKFRNKDYGWHSCQISICGQNGLYTQPASTDMFYKIYTSGFGFRDSCYNCNLKLNNSYSDIRIGDYWGEKFSKNEDGVSLVLINTEIGKRIWNDYVKENVFSENVDFAEVKSAQGLINNTYSSKVKKMRKRLKACEIQEVVETMCRPPLAYRIYDSLPENVKNFYRTLKKMM